jgi:hypothetical protein
VKNYKTKNGIVKRSECHRTKKCIDCGVIYSVKVNQLKICILKYEN